MRGRAVARVGAEVSVVWEMTGTTGCVGHDAVDGGAEVQPTPASTRVEAPLMAKVAA
jgi:hypothetical protein